MVTLQVFLSIVRDLRLPMDAAPESSLQQRVTWSSIHRVRLFAAVEKATGVRAEVAALFAATSVAEVFAAFAGPAALSEGQRP